MTSQGVAPSVAPTWKKRGPRPHPMVWRGRLPIWTAPPCRALLVTQSLYTNLLNARLEFQQRFLAK